MRAQEGRVVYLFTERLETLVVDIGPYLLHIIPICDDTVLQGVSDLEQAAQLGGGSLAYEDLSLQGTG